MLKTIFNNSIGHLRIEDHTHEDEGEKLSLDFDKTPLFERVVINFETGHSLYMAVAYFEMLNDDTFLKVCYDEETDKVTATFESCDPLTVYQEDESTYFDGKYVVDVEHELDQEPFFTAETTTRKYEVQVFRMDTVIDCM